MKSISMIPAALIPAALLFAATAGLGASTDCPAPSDPTAQTAGSAASAPVTSSAPPKATASETQNITTDQILERLFGRRSNDLEIKNGPGGSKLLDLQGRFSLVSIIVRNPDGTIGHFCVDNIDAAKKLLAGQSKPAFVPAAAPAPLQ